MDEMDKMWCNTERELRMDEFKTIVRDMRCPNCETFCCHIHESLLIGFCFECKTFFTAIKKSVFTVNAVTIILEDDDALIGDSSSWLEPEETVIESLSE